jgi:predicted DNA-binding transcriptional regulator AlpA
MENNEDQNEDQNVFLEKLLTENEILQLFGISKATLSRLRNEMQLPFCQITQQRRIYFVDSIEAWLKGKERTLNSD